MTLWGGRFSDGPAHSLWQFTVSHADRRLLEVDVEGSIAHLAGLGAAELVTRDEQAALEAGLREISEEAADGSFTWLDTDEDVHSAVERRLGEIAGPVAAKLHTARSRNDQIALDIRLYLAGEALRRMDQIRGLIEALVDRAEAAGDVVVASYTHLQQAQAVPLAHHLLAHAWPLVRDLDRFAGVRRRLDVSPLGAAAGGGTSLPIDPMVAADSLGLGGVFDNSIDAVSSRDVAAEYLWCCTRAMVDISRLSEDLVLWATTEFGWASYPDSVTTGSSALPHKKNPDIAELARGKAGSAIGHLTGFLAMEKGLPLAYDRDLQQDKEHLFTVDDDLAGALAALTEMVSGAVLDPPHPSAWVTAMDLAEVLVERGVAFREAHEIVGRFVGALQAGGRTFESVDGGEIAAVHEALEPGDVAVLDPVRSVARRRSHGGGSFESVAVQIRSLREGLAASDR